MTTLTLIPDDVLDAPVARAGAGGERDDERGARGGEPDRHAPRAAEGRGRRTLDELIVGVWEDLHAHHAATCPMCGEAMVPRYGSGPAPVGGRCASCGTSLA
jgi:hypothetical protein